MLHETYLENKRQKHITLTATRDIAKAFDTVWLTGLTYKIYKITDKDIHFTRLMHSYYTNRQIIPFFNNIQGPSFTPMAGVPQGSVLGPLLYLIYVNDIPPPIYKDTIRTQFADDLMTMTRSEILAKKPTPKLKQARIKLKQELELISRWEEDWKIKVNPTKCTVGVRGDLVEGLEAIGGIKINHSPVQISNNIKILGYSFSHDQYSTNHTGHISHKAKYTLSQLNRFHSAPKNIKRHLYLALVRAILEYPSTQLSNAGITNIKKLQRHQNKATRFITNTKISQYVTSKTLHENCKLLPLNIRLTHLKYKVLNKINETYMPSDGLYPEIFNAYSDYEIQGDPRRERRKSVAKRIVHNIFTNQHKHRCPWFQPPALDSYDKPEPVFT